MLSPTAVFLFFLLGTFIRIATSTGQCSIFSRNMLHSKTRVTKEFRKRIGVVIEHLTPNRKILGSIPTSPKAAPCCVLEQGTLTSRSTG